MIPVHIDRELVPFELPVADVGELFAALAPRMRDRVLVSVVLNGWERIDPHDASGTSIPLELVSEVWIETESLAEALGRALRSASALAIHAASTATRAGEAFQGGRDAEGYLGFSELCGFADSLAGLANALPQLGAPRAHFDPFLDVWGVRCVQALAALVTAGEGKDVTLVADHLLYDVAPAFEALGVSGSPT